MTDFVWPSDIDRAENEELNRVCEYLERVIDELDGSIDKPVVTEVKPIYVVETNTDLTEGRGFLRPMAICEKKSTALRLGKGRYIMGTDCPIGRYVAVKINGNPTWLVPGVIELMSKEDMEAERKLEQRQQLLERVRAAGLSEEDIAALTRGKDL